WTRRHVDACALELCDCSCVLKTACRWASAAWQTADRARAQLHARHHLEMRRHTTNQCQMRNLHSPHNLERCACDSRSPLHAGCSATAKREPRLWSVHSPCVQG